MKSLFSYMNIRLLSGIVMLAFLPALCPGFTRIARADDSSPPKKPVKLVFIHHSCGENWLADDHGGLGRALGRNNYYVSDTNYGWGPDGIGDRTDITNWSEWFTGPRSARYLKALYREGGVHSPYTRTLPDPGGENRIILFKSCFPNSNLEGSPNDPPRRGGGLTVANAKAIYNGLLSYFSTRPDKLFVAVTAPPVQERTYSSNARAFNTWLVRKWLAGYKGANVAVFDFYNVLTGPGNHHRFRKGKTEHIIQPGRNTLHYPTNGDDHPSPAGNRKATRDFIDLLNVYYHRWQEITPASALISPPAPAEKPPGAPDREVPAETPPEPACEEDTAREEPPAPSLSSPFQQGGVIDGFETASLNWESFLDGEKDTRLALERDQARFHNGQASLRITYDIAPESWATCSLVYPSPQDFQRARGLTIHVHGQKEKQTLVIIAYQGTSPDNLSHFEYKTETTPDAVSGWQRIEIPWEQFIQAAWEGDGTAKFDPTKAMGVAFAFEGKESGRVAGRIWVDDLSLMMP